MIKIFSSGYLVYGISLIALGLLIWEEMEVGYFSSEDEVKIPFYVENHKKNRSFETNRAKWRIYLPPTGAKQLERYNLTSLSQEEKEFMNNYMPVMKSRSKAIREYCENHPELGSPKPFLMLKWITREKPLPDIAWCVNMKVGSGTWTTNFLRVAHFNEDNPAIKLLPLKQQDKARFSPKYGAFEKTVSQVFRQPKTREEKDHVFRNAIRLIVVRHPFIRILSAYRDRIARKAKRSSKSRNNMQKMIVKMFRPPDSNNKNQSPTFKEFVRYLIKMNSNMNSNEKTREHKFWKPFYSHCSVCASDYTVIAKLESLEEDERFLSILGSLDELKQKSKVNWEHMIGNTSSTTIAKNYYLELSKEEILELYDIYKHDFALFQYDIQEYLHPSNSSTAKPKPNS